MTPEAVSVTAMLRAMTGKEAEVRKELLSLVNPSRKDPGCLSYDLHESTGQPGTFLFYENWASKSSLDQHLSKPDLQALLGRIGKLLVEPPQLQLWRHLRSTSG